MFGAGEQKEVAADTVGREALVSLRNEVVSVNWNGDGEFNCGVFVLLVILIWLFIVLLGLAVGDLAF